MFHISILIQIILPIPQTAHTTNAPRRENPSARITAPLNGVLIMFDYWTNSMVRCLCRCSAIARTETGSQAIGRVCPQQKSFTLYLWTRPLKIDAIFNQTTLKWIRNNLIIFSCLYFICFALLNKLFSFCSLFSVFLLGSYVCGCGNVSRG